MGCFRRAGAPKASGAQWTNTHFSSWDMIPTLIVALFPAIDICRVRQNWQGASGLPGMQDSMLPCCTASVRELRWAPQTLTARRTWAEWGCCALRHTAFIGIAVARHGACPILVEVFHSC